MTERTAVRAGPPPAAQPVSILAMDHRDSFGRTLFGVHGTPTAEHLAAVRSAREVIFTRAQRLVATESGAGRLGILVDEQLGADVARHAKGGGFVLAMPVERSGCIRKAAAGVGPRGSHLGAWTTQSLLAEVDALRVGE
jgi:myo-inositol catabolism protein IolC